MELTVRPWQLNRARVAVEYEIYLEAMPGLSVPDLTRGVARQAARLRGGLAVRPADALVLGTASEWGATAVVTNDRALVRVQKLLDVIVLDDLVDGARVSML